MSTADATARDDADVVYTGRRRGGTERPGFWLRVAVILVKPTLMLFTRRTWRGMRHIPPTGGAILACNHITHVDPLVVAHFVYNSGRNPSFLAKAAVFKLPVIGRIIKATGQIAVHRGGADAIRSLHEAIDAVNDGKSVIFYPEGTTSKQPDHWPMRGKTGVARLAAETGAPVIPISHWGSQALFDPIRKKLRLRPRTRVTVVAGEPVDLSRWHGAEPSTETLTAMSEAIMLRVRDQVADIRGETPPDLYDLKAARAARHRDDDTNGDEQKGTN